MKPYIDVQAGQYIDGDAVVEEGPGAEILTSARKYIPGYSDNNIVYLDTDSGNDANDGSTELLAKLTYASAATAAGSTKKIQKINSGALVGNITKPTEMKRGISGWIEPTASALATWTQAGTPSFGATDVYCVASNGLGRLVAGGGSGKLAYSDDGGDTWTQGSGLSSLSINDVIYCPYYERWYAVSLRSVMTSADGIAWSSIPVVEAFGVIGHITTNNSGRLVAFGASAQVFISTDGESFQEALYDTIQTASTKEWSAAYHVPTLGLYVASLSTNSGADNDLYYSADAVSWTLCAQPAYAGTATKITFSESLGIILTVTTGGSALVSSDGITFAEYLAGGGQRYAAAYSPAHGKFITAGASGVGSFSEDYSVGNTSFTSSFGATTIYDAAFDHKSGRMVMVGFSGKIARSNAVAANVQADIAGFTLKECGFNSGITLYSCTAQDQLFSSTNLNTVNCRAKSMQTTGNEQAHVGLLVENSLNITCAPVAENDLSIRSATVGGIAIIRNASATYFEQIQDCVFVGGIQAAYGVAVFGGLANGTNVNAVFDGTGTDDPQFIDETDYKPKRAIEGYTQDSPLVAGSLVYLNSLGVARDLGAWSFREENLETKYRRHFAILKPSQKDAIKFQKHLLTSANPTANGTPSVVNVPEAAWEELILQYGSVNTEEKGFLRNQLELLEYMEGKENLAVRLSWDGDDAINSVITANGVQAAGSPTITVDETDIEPGVKFLWQGTRYTVMRVSGSVLLLERDLADEIPDTTEIDLLSPAGYGDYRMILEKDPILTLNHFAQTDYKRGMVLRFARQCP